MIREDRGYEQRRIEAAACSKMAAFLFLGGLVFAFSPNPAAFNRLAANGLSFSPLLLAVLNVLGAAAYLWLRNGRAARWSNPARRVVFFLASLPILAYLIPFGIIGLATGTSVVTICYSFIFAVFLLLLSAVYGGYSDTLDRVTLVLLALFMFVIASVFTQTPMMFGFKFPVVILVVLAIGGGFGYVLLLMPPARALPLFFRRAGFIVSEVVVALFGLLQFFNNLLFGGSWFVPLALIDLYFCIALLPYALYRHKDHALNPAQS